MRDAPLTDSNHEALLAAEICRFASDIASLGQSASQAVQLVHWLATILKAMAVSSPG